MKTNTLLFLLVFGAHFCFSQLKNYKGVIVAKGNIEGIHIKNTTSKTNATSTKSGTFNINAQIGDQIVFSSIRFKPKTVILSSDFIQNELFIINLEVKINELDEVLVGKILTGNLYSDINNSSSQPEINFYDLGIPGYTGPPKTIVQRALHDADAGKLFPSFTSVNIHKLLNKISGRTKKLKQNVKLEQKQLLLKKIKEQYTSTLFKNSNFDQHFITTFFYYCADDAKFLELGSSSNINIIEFLNQKLNEFKANLK